MRPLVRPIEPAEHVQHRRLAGAVRSDDREHLPGMHREADVLQRGDPAEPQQYFLDLQIRLRRGGARGLMAFAHVGEGEHRRVARPEQIGAELRALRVRPYRIANVDVHAEPDGAEPVAYVRALAALGERAPRLRRDLAVLVVDQEVPARSGLVDLRVDDVVERIHFRGSAERHSREIDLERLTIFVKREPLRDRSLTHRCVLPRTADSSSVNVSSPWPSRLRTPRRPRSPDPH